MLLAVSSGVLYGLTGALTKSVMDSFEDGIIDALEPLLTNWETYASAVCITAGMFLQQSAYQAGNLAESLPAITVLEPVVAVILGVAILDERFTAEGIFQWTVLALSAIGMTVATIELSPLVGQSTTRRSASSGPSLLTAADRCPATSDRMASTSAGVVRTLGTKYLPTTGTLSIPSTPPEQDADRGRATSTCRRRRCCGATTRARTSR